MKSAPNRRTMVKINRFTQARLIALLLEGVLDCQELAAETGLHYVTVLNYARELYRAKAAYVARWNPDSRGRFNVKVYKLGKGKDADKPRRTPAQRSQAYRDKMAAHRRLIAVTVAVPCSTA